MDEDSAHQKDQEEGGWGLDPLKTSKKVYIKF